MAVFESYIASWIFVQNCCVFFYSLISRNAYSSTTHVKTCSHGINDPFVFKPLMLVMCRVSESHQPMGAYKPI